MNGAQDLGGAMGFGPVRPEADEPVFHDAWERRAFAITLAMGASGQWNLDQTRSARESLPPVRYLSNSYYQTWLDGLAALLLERGLVTQEEIEQGRSLRPPLPGVRVLRAADVDAALARGSPTHRAAPRPAAFAVGDPVRAIEMNPTGHTRLPRYVRDKRGRVQSVHGAHVFPDTHAGGQGECPAWLYTVAFDATELWGTQASPGTVFVDCWEPYLRHA
jgi:nitrile hydratase